MHVNDILPTDSGQPIYPIHATPKGDTRCKWTKIRGHHRVSGGRSESRPIECWSTGAFKAGKFEKKILLQFSPNEVYFYDINIKLFGIVY